MHTQRRRRDPIVLCSAQRIIIRLSKRKFVPELCSMPLGTHFQIPESGRQDTLLTKEEEGKTHLSFFGMLGYNIILVLSVVSWGKRWSQKTLIYLSFFLLLFAAARWLGGWVGWED
jgi:hypothetical protein